MVEERLRVGKREVQRGGMRVRRVVSERPVEEQVVLRDETVRVDRHPVDRTLDAADGDLFTEQTFEFTETDEEAVIAKEAHVIEEVVVGKDVENPDGNGPRHRPPRRRRDRKNVSELRAKLSG